ncbi:hypothetical protein BgiBS90_001114 [Biomphalaria glabrata]|nr:hypothetical protein BgiBS90_001114 [Biomphalaria glabrata]
MGMNIFFSLQCRRTRSKNALTLHSKGPEASAETNSLPSESRCSRQPAQQPNSIIRLLPSANDVSGNTSSVISSLPVSVDRVIIAPHNPTHQHVTHAETLQVDRLSTSTTRSSSYSEIPRRRRRIRLGASSSSVVRASESITSQAEQNLSRSRRLQKPPSIPDLCGVNPESRPLPDNVVYGSHRTTVIGAEAAPCGPESSSSVVRASESITSQAMTNLSRSATSEKLPASDKMVNVNGRLPNPPSIPDLCGVNPESRPLLDNVVYRLHRTNVIGAEAAPCGPVSTAPPPRLCKARRSRLNEHYVYDSEPSEKKFDLRGFYLDPAMALFYAFYHQMKKNTLNVCPKCTLMKATKRKTGLVMIDFCEEADEEKDLDDDTDSDD